MKAWESKIVPVGLALAGVLFLFAAFKPMFTGESLNAAFFALGIVSLILSLAVSRKRPSPSP